MSLAYSFSVGRKAPVHRRWGSDALIDGNCPPGQPVLFRRIRPSQGTKLPLPSQKRPQVVALIFIRDTDASNVSANLSCMAVNRRASLGASATMVASRLFNRNPSRFTQSIRFSTWKGCPPPYSQDRYPGNADRYRRRPGRR